MFDLRAMVTTAWAAACGHLTGESMNVERVPSRKSQRTPEQVAELQRAAAEKRERKNVKRYRDYMRSEVNNNCVSYSALSVKLGLG